MTADPRLAAEAAARYRRALLDYLNGGGERALLEAYGLGRRAVATGSSIQDIAAVHHQVLAEALAAGRKAGDAAAMVRRAGEFFAEFAAPFAMPIPFEETVAERKTAEAQKRRLEALEELDALKDQFLSMLSHELRTPLNAIIGFESILSDDVAGPLNPTQHKYLTKIGAAATWLLSLINDLLDLSSIQAGKFQVYPEDMQINDVLADVAGAIEPMAESKRLALRIDAPDDLPSVKADRQRIGQVVLNLLNNAVKFTPEGGSITIRACLDGGGLVCEVQDTGIGIAPDQVPHLFQRFYQVDMRDSRPKGGTGLGLSISKALVEAHGGQIGVVSKLGEGSTFWFRLPASPARDNPPVS